MCVQNQQSLLVYPKEIDDFARSAHSHFTTKPPRDLLYVLKWTLGSPQEALDITWTIGGLLEAI